MLIAEADQKHALRHTEHAFSYPLFERHCFDSPCTIGPATPDNALLERLCIGDLAPGGSPEHLTYQGVRHILLDGTILAHRKQCPYCEREGQTSIWHVLSGECITV